MGKIIAIILAVILAITFIPLGYVLVVGAAIAIFFIFFNK